MAAALGSLTGALAPVFRLGLEHSVSLAHAALQAASRSAGQGASVSQRGDATQGGDDDQEFAEAAWTRVAVHALTSLHVILLLRFCICPTPSRKMKKKN